MISIGKNNKNDGAEITSMLTGAYVGASLVSGISQKLSENGNAVDGFAIVAMGASAGAMVGYANTVNLYNKSYDAGEKMGYAAGDVLAKEMKKQARQARQSDDISEDGSDDRFVVEKVEGESKLSNYGTAIATGVIAGMSVVSSQAQQSFAENNSSKGYRLLVRGAATGAALGLVNSAFTQKNGMNKGFSDSLRSKTRGAMRDIILGDLGEDEIEPVPNMDQRLQEQDIPVPAFHAQQQLRRRGANGDLQR